MLGSFPLILIPNSKIKGTNNNNITCSLIDKDVATVEHFSKSVTSAISLSRKSESHHFLCCRTPQLNSEWSRSFHSCYFFASWSNSLKSIMSHKGTESICIYSRQTLFSCRINIFEGKKERKEHIMNGSNYPVESLNFLLDANKFH